jgi:Transglycosylase SLT domain/Domain of unknown function (DUF4124)
MWDKLLTVLEMLIKNRRRRNELDRRVARDASCEGVGDRRAGPPDRRASLRYLGFGVLCLGLAAPASAQIYSWRDAGGNMVLSNRRQNAPDQAEVRSYAVPKAETVRATRPVAPERVRVFDDLISEHSHNQNVREDLVRAVVQVESAFNPRARSSKGAMGLMQLMPATARQYGVMDAFNPADNIRGGVTYLRSLLDRYSDNEELALAAYNAGPGAVDRHGQHVPPYLETRNYVTRINLMAAKPVPKKVDKSIYRVTETIDGRAVERYTNQKPEAGPYALADAR